MKWFYRSIQLTALAAPLSLGCGSVNDVDTQTDALTASAAKVVSCPIFATCYVVTSIADSGAGTLRQAIIDANAATGTRIIKFDITSPVNPPYVIQPLTNLPMLLGDTTIDGFSQPGTARATDTSPPVIHVVINGLFSAGNWGLNLGIGRNVVQGLAINDFVPGSAVIVNSDDNKVRGNMLGVDRDATFVRPNGQAGVKINVGTGNLIGGVSMADRNVISGNDGEGVEIFGSGANEIYNNVIGMNFDGTVPLGNGGPGVALHGTGGNEIGGVDDGEANIIAFNGGDGITVFDGRDNTLSHNSLHDNSGLGIDLTDDGVTRNDGLLDPDVGANGLQNFPRLNSAVMDPNTEYLGKFKTEVDWQLSTEANTKVRVEFFAGPTCDPSGHGEAERFLGSRAINTDPTGFVQNVWILPGRVYPGEVITATATKFVRVGTDYVATETSELSKCFLATMCTGTSCGSDSAEDPCSDGTCDDDCSHGTCDR